MSEDIVLRSVRNCVLILVAASMLAACGGGGSSLGPSMTPPNNPGGGGVLSTRMLKGAQGFVNGQGFTVYVFDLDLTDPGHSTCNAGNGCSTNWPAVAPPASVALTGGFGQITRTDGNPQLTYNGRPLYSFVGDASPGQANGDGLNEFGGIWHIARPQSQASPTPAPSSSSPMPTPTPY